MREKQVELALIKKIKSCGGIAIKFVAPGMSGVPDRLVLYPGGRIFFVELKAPGKKATPRQLKVQEQLRGFGFEVFLLDSREAVDEFVNGVKSNGTT